MEPTQAAHPDLLARYEGLVFTTSSMYDGIKRYDPEEVQQILRIKVWRALLAFNPARYPKPKRLKAMDSFVFGCLRNEIKDLLKRDRERELLIEDVAAHESPLSEPGGQHDRFEFRYLQTDHEEVFGTVEDSAPLIPNTLSPDERRVLCCLYLGHNGPTTAEKLGLTRSRVATAVREIRKKMRDWEPDEEPEPSPSPAPAVSSPSPSGSTAVPSC